MVQIPDLQEESRNNGNKNELIYEEIVFKDFVRDNGKSKNTRKNLTKLTFVSEDGREWTIWGSKEYLSKIFSPIEVGDRIRVAYRKSRDRLKDVIYNNVKSIEKINKENKTINETINNENINNNTDLNLPNLREIGEKATKEDIIKRLRAIEMSLTSMANFVRETLKNM